MGKHVKNISNRCLPIIPPITDRGCLLDSPFLSVIKQFEVTRLKKRKRNFEKMLRKFLRESDEKQKKLKKRREKRK
jgi:hypothetical protein